MSLLPRENGFDRLRLSALEARVEKLEKQSDTVQTEEAKKEAEEAKVVLDEYQALRAILHADGEPLTDRASQLMATLTTLNTKLSDAGQRIAELTEANRVAAEGYEAMRADLVLESDRADEWFSKWDATRAELKSKGSECERVRGERDAWESACHKTEAELERVTKERDEARIRETVATLRGPLDRSEAEREAKMWLSEAAEVLCWGPAPCRASLADLLQRVADQARRAALEEAAKECDSQSAAWDNADYDDHHKVAAWQGMARACARNIRALIDAPATAKEGT